MKAPAAAQQQQQRSKMIRSSALLFLMGLAVLAVTEVRQSEYIVSRIAMKMKTTSSAAAAAAATETAAAAAATVATSRDAKAVDGTEDAHADTDAPPQLRGQRGSPVVAEREISSSSRRAAQVVNDDDDDDDDVDSDDDSHFKLKTAYQMNLTVAVVGNEFFDPSIGRTGGFGMSTNWVGKFFKKYHPDLNVNVVFVFADPSQGDSTLLTEVHHRLLDWPMISMVPDKEKKKQAVKALRDAKIDVFLTIDYRTAYDKIFYAMPDTPIIIWGRDPRTPQQIRNLQGIRLPAAMGYYGRPQGCGAPDATNARNWFEKRKSDDNPTNEVAIGTVYNPALRDRLWGAYNIPVAGNAFELPNIIDGCLERTFPKSEKPSVIFMGRLDPYKRPWLLVELARKFSNVDFWVFGRQHFEGPGSYNITKDSGPLPGNVKLFGQLTGDEKWEHFQRAWFVLSASAHEGLAINYLEALECGTPVLSTVNPGGVVSSYGIFAGEYSGSGEQGLPALERGFRTLLENEELRTRLGEEGRKHVLETHNAGRFLEGFQRLSGHLGLLGPTKDWSTMPSASAPEQREELPSPITIVVPSTWPSTNQDKLPAMLAKLLCLDGMKHYKSEVLLLHGNEESWLQRAMIHTETNRVVLNEHGRSSFEVTKLIHADSTRIGPPGAAAPTTRGCEAQRFAAKEAGNDVLVYFEPPKDGGFVPTDEDLKLMIKKQQEQPACIETASQ